MYLYLIPPCSICSSREIKSQVKWLPLKSIDRREHLKHERGVYILVTMENRQLNGQYIADRKTKCIDSKKLTISADSKIMCKF